MSNCDAKTGILEILNSLEDNDLITLARTVTQGLLKKNSREDSIKSILKYSPDEISILRRKLVTREILFSYLDEKNIPVKLPTTKNDLIDQIVEFWNLSSTTDHSQGSNSIVANLDSQANKESRSTDAINLMAEQFTTWWYGLMNSDEIIGSEHFYPDAKLTLNMYTNDDCDTTVLENSPDMVKTLYELKSRYKLFFNPNLSKEGIQGRMDPHGLVIVLVCGTLHIQEACTGVFEQVFALARDPFCDNNWKIKNSELNLRSKSDISCPPRLSDAELTSNLLMLPSTSQKKINKLCK